MVPWWSEEMESYNYIFHGYTKDHITIIFKLERALLCIVPYSLFKNITNKPILFMHSLS